MTYYSSDIDYLFVRVYFTEDDDYTLDFYATPEERAALNVVGADVLAILAPRLAALPEATADDVIGVQIEADDDMKIMVYPPEQAPNPASLWWNQAAV